MDAEPGHRSSDGAKHAVSRGNSRSRQRADYATAVSRAQRQAILRAIECGGLNRRARVFFAALYLTAGYSRLSDERVYAAQVARLAGVDERATRRELRWFHKHGALVWKGARGAHRPSALALPAPVPEKGVDCDPLSAKKGSQIEPKKGIRSDPPTERLDRVASRLEEAFEHHFDRPARLSRPAAERLETAVAALPGGLTKAVALLVERRREGAVPHSLAWFIPAFKERGAEHAAGSAPTGLSKVARLLETALAGHGFVVQWPEEEDVAYELKQKCGLSDDDIELVLEARRRYLADHRGDSHPRAEEA